LFDRQGPVLLRPGSFQSIGIKFAAETAPIFYKRRIGIRGMGNLPRQLGCEAAETLC